MIIVNNLIYDAVVWAFDTIQTILREPPDEFLFVCRVDKGNCEDSCNIIIGEHGLEKFSFPRMGFFISKVTHKKIFLTSNNGRSYVKIFRWI